MHTRKTDERILMQFARDHGWDDPDVMEAVSRLEKCHIEELQDYGISESEE